MKKALITGDAGFIGGHFFKHLQDQGWDLWAGDIVDGKDARDFFAGDDMVFDLVIHAAYHVGGRAAIDGLNTHMAKNLELDAAMFQWAVRTRQRRVVYFSSSAVYPIQYQTDEWLHYWGEDRSALEEIDVEAGRTLMPDKGYGWAKLTGERLAQMANAHGVPVTIVRPFSGYGENQSLDYPFPSIVDRALKGDYTVWGPQGQTRDWIHIDDVIAATMAVVESGTHMPVNICTGIGTEMGQLLQLVVDQAHILDPDSHPCGKEITVTYQPDKPTGVFYRVGDPSLMHTFYTPKISLEEGVCRAIKARAKA